ncbi:MAG TPA: nuclear transport factor 2 family protein [Thiobacillus sp.]|nr:nuclear transport factor 2 family protein [Thiobacillus sp.]
MSEPTFPSPEAAEAAFYAAFETRSLDAMMSVWASDGSIACIHPMAAPLNGRTAVAAGWRSMFEAAGQFRVHAELAHEMREAGEVIRIVREYLVIGQETEPRPPILATNVYRKGADGSWRMVLHHASPLQVGGTPPSRTPPVVLH